MAKRILIELANIVIAVFNILGAIALVLILFIALSLQNGYLTVDKISGSPGPGTTMYLVMIDPARDNTLIKRAPTP